MFYNLLVEWFRFWAKLKLKRWQPKIIAVTGSLGKTSFIHILDKILQAGQISHRTSFGANSEIGLPLNILLLKPATTYFDWLKLFILAPFKSFQKEKKDYYLAEMAIDSLKYPKNMKFLLSLFTPQISCCLSVSPMHTYQFSLESGLKEEDGLLKLIAQEKSQLLKATLLNHGWVIYNLDNHYLKKEMEAFLNDQPFLKPKAKGLSLFLAKSSIFVTSEINNNQTIIELSYQGKKYKFQINHLPLFREYNRIIGSAVVIGLELGIPSKKIQEGLNKFRLPGRLTLIKGIKNSLILDSSYNAPYEAMIKIINHFYFLFPKKEKILVLGEMRELGPLSQEKHKELAKLVANLDYKYLLIIGEKMRKYFLPQIKKLKEMTNILYFSTSLEIGWWLKKYLQGGEAILFKGSQNTIFLEEAIKPLLLNPSDKNLLVRQSPLWLKKKKAFFKKKFTKKNLQAEIQL